MLVTFVEVFKFHKRRFGTTGLRRVCLLKVGRVVTFRAKIFLRIFVFRLGSEAKMSLASGLAKEEYADVIVRGRVR